MKKNCDRGSLELGMVALWICQGMGAAYLKRLQGVAISCKLKSREFERHWKFFLQMQLLQKNQNLVELAQNLVESISKYV